jgi:hypothetical protein
VKGVANPFSILGLSWPFFTHGHRGHERLHDAIAGKEQQNFWWVDMLHAMVFFIVQLICCPIVATIVILPIILMTL